MSELFTLNLLKDLRIFAPELIVLITILFILIVEPLVKKEDRKNLWTLSLIGLLGAFTVLLYSYEVKTKIFSFNLYIDAFSSFFRIIACISGILAVLLSHLSSEIDDRDGEPYVAILTVVLGMLIIPSAGNLLIIYLAFEMMSLPSYLLTSMQIKSYPSKEAGIKYLLFGAVSSGIMLYGFSLLYGITGQIDINAIKVALNYLETKRALGILAFLLISAGMFFKIAAFPFYFWSPDAYQGAPTPVAGFLSIGPKAAGFAFMIRFILSAFSEEAGEMWEDKLWGQIPQYIGFISAITMTIGNLAALNQKSVKRMLAYSSIAHAGYMLIGLSAMNRLGIHAILFYVLVYIFMNLGAFASISYITRRGMKDDLDSYKGIGWKAPLFGVTTTIFLFSLVGIPPLGGFVGKVLIFASAVKERMWVLVIIGVLNSVISLYYYALIVKKMFLESFSFESEFKLSFLEALLLIICAIPVVFLGIFWGKTSLFLERALSMF
jgi:NADH-quinone oxidoreductase subunit N